MNPRRAARPTAEALASSLPLVASDVFGTLTVNKNNVTLVSNRVQGAFEAVGGNPECTDNHAFSDANTDQIVQDGELGDELTCAG